MADSSKSRRLPIEKDDYKKIIDEDCVYIDKTLLVKEFWDSGSEVVLITRPRRFGKSSALSERYVIKSNLESGLGRYDIAMYLKRGDPAILIELKKGKSLKLDKIADQALEQITLNRYESSLKDFGYKGPVLCYGVATFKKHLVAKMKKLSS